MLEQLPPLTNEGKPEGIFGQTIHDNCERRGHFENGEFVYEFGSEEEAMGYCLYPLGCRGPQTKSNCGVIAVEQPPQLVRAGGRPLHRLLRGQRRTTPATTGSRSTPRSTSAIATCASATGWSSPAPIALGITGILAAALVVHGFGMKITGRMDGGADFEKVRAWDAKHPDKAIGKYDLTRDEAKAACEKSSHDANAKAVNPMKKKGGKPT